jgi:hypothetical protein
MAYDSNHRQVSTNYLQTMNVPLRQGRYFESSDNAQSMPVAIVNETMARQYWPGENALGRRFKLGGPEDTDVPWVQIVGIVADIRQMGLDEPVKAEMYFPYQQGQSIWYIPRDLVIRTTGDTSGLIGSVRQAIREVDPDQPVSNVATMAEVLGTEAAQRRMGMIMLVARVVTRVARYLRSARLFRHATHRGDWRKTGARRHATQHSVSGVEKGNGTDGGGYRDWSYWRVCTDAVDEFAAVRREGIGSVDVCDGAVSARTRGVACVFDSGTPRHAHRSTRGAAI